jgi:hypothetical protein
MLSLGVWPCFPRGLSIFMQFDTTTLANSYW